MEVKDSALDLWYGLKRGKGASWLKKFRMAGEFEADIGEGDTTLLLEECRDRLLLMTDERDLDGRGLP